MLHNKNPLYYKCFYEKKRLFGIRSKLIMYINRYFPSFFVCFIKRALFFFILSIRVLRDTNINLQNICRANAWAGASKIKHTYEWVWINFHFRIIMGNKYYFKSIKGNYLISFDSENSVPIITCKQKLHYLLHSDFITFVFFSKEVPNTSL